MTLFHVLAVQTDATGGTLTFNGFNITFASRDDADVWWRWLEHEQGWTDAIDVIKSIKRITPQFYTYEKSNYTTLEGIRKDFFKGLLRALHPPPIDSPVLNRVILTLKPADRAFEAADAKIRDHVNKKTFFIRSERDPSLYWHADGKGHIEASRNHSTKFRISITDDNTATDSTIMIGSDTVEIAVAFQNDGSTTTTPCPCNCDSCTCNDSNPGSVNKNESGELVVSSSPITFRFEAFRNGFAIESIAYQNASASSMAIVQVVDGEAWELV